MLEFTHVLLFPEQQRSVLREGDCGGMEAQYCGGDLYYSGTGGRLLRVDRGGALPIATCSEKGSHLLCFQRYMKAAFHQDHEMP